MIETHDSPNGLVREVYDTENPRLYCRYYKCHFCMEWIHEEDVVWLDEDDSGEYNTPYHVECAPEQED